MQTLHVEAPTTKERGIQAVSRVTKMVGERRSACFTASRGGTKPTTWTECYTDDGDLTYADADYARSLVESLEAVQVLGHSVDSFSAVASIEATGIINSVDPQHFVPPYRLVQS